MNPDEILRDKLRKIEALFAGAATPGEKAASTPRKAANSARAPMASVGVAGNNQALRCRIGSDARPSAVKPATGTVTTALLPSASREPKT